MRGTLNIATCLAAATALGLAATPAAATRVTAGYQTSWGKAGVSLEEYWVDASLCGHQAAATDLTDSDPAKALVLASRMIDNYSDYEDIALAEQVASPEIQWNRAATILQRSLERCLMERGYVKFRLTKSQAHRLKKLKTGSLERRQYLYSLASDPDVLAAQAQRQS
jgi:hypothetical protein